MEDPDGISRRDLLRGRMFRKPAPDEQAASASAPNLDPTPRRAMPLLRPPGAIEEVAFLDGCTRCNDCAEACPVDAIFPLSPRFGDAKETPGIDPMKSPCVMCDDTPCISACEPAVLRPDGFLTMGTAVIKAMHCLAYNGTICTVCSERCPVPGAIDLVNGRPVINEDPCTGCGVCQYVCPAPYNAIAIRPNAARYEDADHREDSPAAGPDWRADLFGGRSLRPEDNMPSTDEGAGE